MLLPQILFNFNQHRDRCGNHERRLQAITVLAIRKILKMALRFMALMFLSTLNDIGGKPQTRIKKSES